MYGTIYTIIRLFAFNPILYTLVLNIIIAKHIPPPLSIRQRTRYGALQLLLHLNPSPPLLLRRQPSLEVLNIAQRTSHTPSVRSKYDFDFVISLTV